MVLQSEVVGPLPSFTLSTLEATCLGIDFWFFCLQPVWTQFKLSSKAVWGLPWGTVHISKEEHGTLRKVVREHYGNLLFQFCSCSLILCVMPQWWTSSARPEPGAAFLNQVGVLRTFPWSLDFDTKQAHVPLLLLLFKTYSPWVPWATWIPHNLSWASLQLLPLCSKNGFLISHDFVTQPCCDVDILFIPVSH